MFEGFGFSDTGKWFSDNRFNELKSFEGNFPILFNPIPQIFDELGVEDSVALGFCFDRILISIAQAQAPYATWQRFSLSFSCFLLDEEPLVNVPRSLESARDGQSLATRLAHQQK